MDMRTIAIATGVFVLLVGGSMAVAMLFLSGDASPDSSPTQPQAQGANPNKQMEDYVLSGYEVKFWGEGKPFVRYYDPGAMAYGEQDIYQALFWQSQAMETARLGGEPGAGNYDPAEAGYRLGLICEHGLFGYQKNASDALRSYRIARVGGHAKGDAAAKRLEAAGH